MPPKKSGKGEDSEGGEEGAMSENPYEETMKNMQKMLDKQHEIIKSYQEMMKQQMGKPEKKTYLSRERKFQKFSANIKDPLDWIEDVGQYVKQRFTVESDKVNFIVELLEHEPKLEVKAKVDVNKATAEEILDILYITFGEKKTTHEIEEEFFNRNQRAEESLTDYSYELMSLMLRMKDKLKLSHENSSELLKNRLASGVFELSLRRELKRLILEQPKMDFSSFRDRALSWLENSDAAKTSKKSTKTSEICLSSDVQQELATCQEQIKNLKLELQEAKKQYTSQNQPGKMGENDRKNFNCYHCGAPGHRARFCYKNPMSQNFRMMPPQYCMPPYQPYMPMPMQSLPPMPYQMQPMRNKSHMQQMQHTTPTLEVDSNPDGNQDSTSLN